MLNMFCKKPLYEVTQTMAKVAMGVEKAELVIKNAKLMNVCTAEIQEGIDVAISQGGESPSSATPLTASVKTRR